MAERQSIPPRGERQERTSMAPRPSEERTIRLETTIAQVREKWGDLGGPIADALQAVQVEANGALGAIRTDVNAAKTNSDKAAASAGQAAGLAWKAKEDYETATKRATEAMGVAEEVKTKADAAEKAYAAAKQEVAQIEGIGHKADAASSAAGTALTKSEEALTAATEATRLIGSAERILRQVNEMDEKNGGGKLKLAKAFDQLVAALNEKFEIIALAFQASGALSEDDAKELAKPIDVPKQVIKND